jgi:hypothetical protein
MRLVRPGFAAYDVEYTEIGNAARRLSPFRDATARIEAFDRLRPAYRRSFERGDLLRVRQRLVVRRNQAVSAPVLAETLAFVRDTFSEIGKRTEWRLQGDGPDCVFRGFTEGNRRARRGVETLEHNAPAEVLHEARKRAKTRSHHLLLLAPESITLSAQLEAANALSDLLGDHRDLEVLRISWEADAAGISKIVDLPVLLRVINRRQEKLHACARTAGKRIVDLSVDPAPLCGWFRVIRVPAD